MTFHFPDQVETNVLTIDAVDPLAKIPEYKVCAVRVRKADEPPEYSTTLEPQQ